MPGDSAGSDHLAGHSRFILIVCVAMAALVHSSKYDPPQKLPFTLYLFFLFPQGAGTHLLYQDWVYPVTGSMEREDHPTPPPRLLW